VLRNPNDHEVTETTGAATASLFEGTSMRMARADAAQETPKPRRKVETPAPVAVPPPVAPAPKTSVIEVLSGATRSQITVTKIPQDQEPRQ
jgi:hypothetical protein